MSTPRALPRTGGLREAGFTLIEALVALFVFGLISTLILGVLSMQARAEATLRGRIEAEDQVVAAQNTLRERMGAMRQLLDPRGSGDTALFRGFADQLEFVAPTFQAEGPRALYRFRLQAITGDKLVLYALSERTSVQTTASQALAWTPLILLSNVK
ncbi:MAG: type II secretion system protein J, partial [Novosphingobium sp.]